MLTPEQVRLRLQRISYHETNTAMADLVGLLEEVLVPLAGIANHLDRTLRDLDEMIETSQRMEHVGRELQQQRDELVRRLEAL